MNTNETYKNTTDPNRNYGKKRQDPAGESFCKSQGLKYESVSGSSLDLLNKVDGLVYTNENKLMYILSIKCSCEHENGSFPRKDLIAENKCTHVLFENKNLEQYVVTYQWLINFIHDGKAIDKGSYYVIYEKYLKNASIIKKEQISKKAYTKALFE